MRSGHDKAAQRPPRKGDPTRVDPASVQRRDDRNQGGALRRSLERMRGGDGSDRDGALEERDDLRLEVMLLREEIARLRTERRRPADVGTLLDQLRSLAAEQGDADAEDEVWSLLAEMSAIREGLQQACVELGLAIAAVRRQLRALSVSPDRERGDGEHTLDSPSSGPGGR